MPVAKLTKEYLKFNPPLNPCTIHWRYTSSGYNNILKDTLIETAGGNIQVQNSSSPIKTLSRLSAQCFIVIAFIDSVRLFETTKQLLIEESFHNRTLNVPRVNKDLYVFISRTEPGIPDFETEAKDFKYKVLLRMDSDLRSRLEPLLTWDQNKTLWDGNSLLERQLPRNLRVALPTSLSIRITLKKSLQEYKFTGGAYQPVFESISKSLNVTPIYFPSTGAGTGLLLRNGTWTGGVGDLVNDRADASTIGWHHRRLQFMDFSTTLEFQSLSFLLNSPSQRYSWHSIFWPFSFELYSLIFVTMLSLATVFVIRHYFQDPRRNKIGELFCRSMFYFYSSFFYQGTTPPITSRRLVLSWYLFILVMPTVFVSKLFFFMAFPIFDPIPTNFKQLVNSEYHYTLWHSRGSSYNFFKNANSQVYQRIFQRMGDYSNHTACIVNAMRKGEACITYIDFAKFIVDTELSDRIGSSSLVYASESALSLPVAVGLRKQSVFEDGVNRVVGSMVDTGNFQHWVEADVKRRRREFLNRRQPQDTSDLSQDGVQPLQMRAILGTFYVGSFGLLLSSALFLLERLSGSWAGNHSVLCSFSNEFFLRRFGHTDDEPTEVPWSFFIHLWNLSEFPYGEIVVTIPGEDPGVTMFIRFCAYIFLTWNLVPPFTVADETTTEVNLLFFYELESTKTIFEQAQKYVNEKIAENGHVKIGKVYPIFSNPQTTEATALITELCKQIDAAYASPDEEKPDFALDFTRQGIPSEAVKVILKSMKIPTITGTFGQEGDIREWRDITDKQKGYLIQVSPPADILIQSVRSIVDMQNMTSAVVLFDYEQYEMYHKYKSLLQNMPTRHLLTKVERSVEAIRKQIDRLVHVDIVNFFIAAGTAEISTVLAESSDPQSRDGPYFSDEYAWYSMSLKPGLPDCSGCKMPVTVVHLSPSDDESKGQSRREFFSNSASGVDATSLTDMFYFDLAIDGVVAIGKTKQQDKDSLKLKAPLKCADYKMTDVNKDDELNLKLYDALRNASKDNMIAFELNDENGKNFPLFKMRIQRLTFDNNQKTPKTNVNVGYWQSGFKEKEAITFENGLDLVEHLAHTVFRIVTVVQPPFVYWKEGCEVNKTDKYHHCFEGYCIDLLEYIRNDLKFNFTIRNVSEYGYMKEDYPHDWTGMVRELKDRQADIALGAMSVMAERESVVDFTVPYYDLVGISILMRKPRATTSLFKFLTVLENDVWMCILGAYFFTSVLMWIFDRWSPYSYQNNREKYEDDEEKREFNLKECLWFCMTSLTPQGGGEAPKNLSGRLVAATWWLFGFIIIASYTANLAAFLTVSRLDAPIESLDDLSKQYKIQYAPQKKSSAWIYFDRMAHIEHRFYEIWKDMSLNDSMSDYERSQLAVWDYPVSDKFTKMWQAMQENEPPDTFEGAILRVRGDESKEDGFAFLGEATDVKYQETISCELRSVGEEFSRKPYAIAVQKGSPLKESFSHMILKLLNQRQLEQLKEQWWNENPHKAVNCPKDDNQSDGISIHNIGGVFIVIFVGIIMACFTLVFEYWWYRKRNIAEEMAEMALPAPKEYGTGAFSAEKTDYNTQYNKTDLPTIENS
ncbi:unnamed protein product, partial [Allacma fusca]